MSQSATASSLQDAERRIFTKIAWRLMPLLVASYILNYLDRTNISFAALTMNQAVGLTATQFGLGAGLFFLGYCLLEVPSNLASVSLAEAVRQTPAPADVVSVSSRFRRR